MWYPFNWICPDLTSWSPGWASRRRKASRIWPALVKATEFRRMSMRHAARGNWAPSWTYSASLLFMRSMLLTPPRWYPASGSVDSIWLRIGASAAWHSFW